MNTRPLTANETINLAALNHVGVTSALLFVTTTGLEKSILDATAPIRTLFRSSDVHDFDSQAQGSDHKIVSDCIVVGNDASRPTIISLYRPVTKHGDPRMWIYGFKDDATPNDVFALFIVSKIIYAINLTKVKIGDLNSPDTSLTRFLAEIRRKSNVVSDELLSMLRRLASNGPICAVRQGDTAIGMSVEAALGIAPNSSRNPDYKGIELKSGRSAINGRTNRATLFACVPDWSISACKSSAEILTQYGYQTGADFKLYCTVSAVRANSQGLQFRIEEAKDLLHEEATRISPELVAIWRMSMLEQRLAEKHRETFWIKAKSESRNGNEWFHLESVLHTRNPNLLQLGRLLAEGAITMDHLIKRTKSGGAAEKGPLFKIQKARIPELFLGESTTHLLQ